MSPIEAGLTANVGLTVTAADTAVAFGSGDVDVLATPRLIALCEAATVEAVRTTLPADRTSVGTRVEIRHLAPSPVGAEVTATARLADVAGRRLVFDVEVLDAGQLVADGRIDRVVVERATFPG